MGTIRVRAISSRRSVVICWSRPISSRALWIEVLSWAIASLTSADTSVMRRDRMLKSSYLSNSSAPKLADRASGDWPPSPVPVAAGKVKECFSSNVRTVSSIRFLYACTWRANCSRTVNRCSKRLRPMTNSPTRLSSRSRRSRLTRTVPWLSSFAPTGCGSASGSVAAGAGGSAVAAPATAEPPAPAATEPEALPQPVGAKELSQGTVRVSRDRLERLLNLVGELVIGRSRLEQRLTVLEQLACQVQAYKNRMLETVRTFEEKHAFTLPAATGTGEDGQSPLALSANFGALEFDKYDDFNILSRRMTEVSADVSEVMAQLSTSIHKAREDMGLLQQMTTDLRDEIARTRMVPIGSLFTRFQKAVREMARTVGKDVEVVFSGAS